MRTEYSTFIGDNLDKLTREDFVVTLDGEPADGVSFSVDEVDGKPDFYFLRMPSRNPSMKPLRKIEILWRPELAHIQELNELPKYAQKSKAFVQEVIVERVDPSLLSIQISDELFERDYNTIGERIKEYRQQHTKRKVRARSKRKLYRLPRAKKK